MQFILIILIYLVVILLGAAKNSKKKQQPPAGPGRPGAGPAAPRKNTDPSMEAWLARGNTRPEPAKPAAPAPAAPQREMFPVSGSLSGISPEGVDPCHDDPFAQPTGSLGVESTEGKDPCHDDWQPASPSLQPAGETGASAGGLRLNWTGDEMVKGFVYGEILRKRA